MSVKRFPLSAAMLLLAAAPAGAETIWTCEIRNLAETYDERITAPQPARVYRVERRRVWQRKMFGTGWEDLCDRDEARIVRRRCTTSRRGFRIDYVVEFDRLPYLTRLDFGTGRLEQRWGRMTFMTGICRAE